MNLRASVHGEAGSDFMGLVSIACMHSCEHSMEGHIFSVTSRAYCTTGRGRASMVIKAQTAPFRFFSGCFIV